MMVVKTSGIWVVKRIEQEHTTFIQANFHMPSRGQNSEKLGLSSWLSEADSFESEKNAIFCTAVFSMWIASWTPFTSLLKTKYSLSVGIEINPISKLSRVRKYSS